MFSLFYEPNDFYTSVQNLTEKENGGVAVAMGWNVKKIDAFRKVAYLEDDTEITYDKCLIATGNFFKYLISLKLILSIW